MESKRYQYRFRINVSHSLNISGTMQSPHMHTLELTLYLQSPNRAFEPYDTFEKIIGKYLENYSGKYLNEIPPFDTIEPTIENIGDEFYQGMKRLIAEHNFELEQLEISDTPSRVYLVSDSMTDEALQNTERGRKLARLCDQMNAEHSVSRLIASASAETPAEADAAEVSAVTVPAPKQKPSVPPETIFSEKEKDRRFLRLKFVIALAAMAGIGILISLYVYFSGNYPLGLDVYGHLFKTDFLYQNIGDGNFYPLYSKYWYNGMQPYRYWPPMSYYILALLQYLAGGDIFGGFVLFAGFSFAVGAVGWLLWGFKENRMFLASFFAVLWFFLPDNLRVFFSEGNLPRMAIAMLLPYLFYFVWCFVSHKEKGKIIPIVLLTALIVLNHVMIGAMAGVTIFLFLLVYSIANREYKESVQAICGMLCGIALTGIYLVPALTGGIMNTNSSDISNVLYVPASVSLNPFLRLQGQVGEYYIGLSVFLIAVIGLFLSNRKSVPGFLTLLVVFAGTTTAFAPLISKLPLSELLWLRRFTPIAYGAFLAGLLCWKQCKKPVIALMCILLLADCIPSFQLDAYRESMPEQIAFDSQEQVAKELSLDTAKAITNQRVTLLDLSSYGPFPSYYFCSGEDAVGYNFGWAWQGASTGSNIVMLNTALEEKWFDYLFDRSLEMGNDTVVISKAILQIDPQEGMEERLVSAAERLNYRLAENGAQSYVFHRETPETFGILTDYHGLAVGSSARAAALMFPYFEEGFSDNLEDYSLEELCSYDTIYLSDFQYYNKDLAEELVRRVTEHGTRILIDVNRLPVNSLTNRKEFMGVYGQDIVFTERFPDLIYQGSIISAEPFAQEYPRWNTVYLEGIDTAEGYCWYHDQQLKAVGTKGNENTVFIGMNLLYHASETGDPAVTKLMEEIFGVSTEELPERVVVPLTVTTEAGKLTVTSDYDNVNTTLAYQDNFVSGESIREKNHLLIVNRGVTEIDLEYPMLLKGLTVTLVGAAVLVLLLVWVFKKRRERHVRQIDYSK